MPKKSFKDNPALAFIGKAQIAAPEESGTHEAQQTQETYMPQEAQGTQEQPAAKYYRLNLKLKAEYRDYLERVSWEAHKSITQYLNDLIEADKATKDTRDI